MQNEIALVPSYGVDREKWDRCVSSSENGLIYAFSFWLDHLADNWTGFVLNDYEAVMPVAWRKKWGIRYSYHVPLVQQLGIYSLFGSAGVERFSELLQSYCRYGSYPFNYANKIEGGRSHTNFVLPLDKNYEEISMEFSPDVIQNIRKSNSAGLKYETAKYGDAIHIFRENYGKKTGLSQEYFERLWKLCGYLEKRGNLIVRSATGTDGKVLAIALLPNDGRRLYNIMNSTRPEGKRTEANYFLLSQLWKEFEGSRLIFDFEGSDIPGVREFYRKFGATNQPYSRLGFNHLPWPIKILKK
ncbi:MAG: hypothetical protein JNK79_10595 [Chitinophagaceae bacterium]|nr:hypothetical protein [Chitinophagaceae bacterium]